MNRVVITGSRDWTDRRCIMRRLMEEPDDTTIIEGAPSIEHRIRQRRAARGVDEIAELVALALGFLIVSVPAQWDVYGRAAGPIRNNEMLDLKPDKVIAFRKNNSPGTTQCINEARRRGIPVEVIEA